MNKDIKYICNYYNIILSSFYWSYFDDITRFDPNPCFLKVLLTDQACYKLVMGIKI